MRFNIAQSTDTRIFDVLAQVLAVLRLNEPKCYDA